MPGPLYDLSVLRGDAPAERPLVSVVAPVYNEEDVIEEFIRRVGAAADSIAQLYQFELILVDDGSSDRSLETMRAMLPKEPRLHLIELRRNYGQTPALQAGLDAASGDIVVTLDADLQHFPEEIPTFLQTLEEGYDMVCGWRHQRREGAIRRWPSRAANLMIRWIARLPIHDFGTTFRAYRSEIVHDMHLFGEFHRFVPALGRDLGARIKEIPIQNIERPAGKSSYGIGRTLGVALDLVLLFFFSRYMDRPMRAFGKLGLLSFLTGSGILSFLLGYAWIYDVPTVREHSGWFLVAVMLMLTSVQIFLAGILAEILARIHYAQQGNRVYRVRQIYDRRGEHKEKPGR